MSWRTEFHWWAVSVIDYINQKLRLVTICDWTWQLIIFKRNGGYYLCEQVHLAEATDMQDRANNNKLQKALRAVAKMPRVMGRSVVTFFDRSKPNLFITSVAALCLGVYLLPIFAAGAFGMGFIVAAKAIMVAVACCISGGGVGYCYSRNAFTNGSTHESSPARCVSNIEPCAYVSPRKQFRQEFREANARREQKVKNISKNTKSPIRVRPKHAI